MNMTVTSAGGVPKGPSISTITVGVLSVVALVISIAALVSARKVSKGSGTEQSAVPALREELAKSQSELSNHLQQSDRYFRAIADELQQNRNMLADVTRRLSPAAAAGGVATAVRGALPPAGAAPAAGPAPAAGAAPSGRVHEIVENDSFSRIAKKYGTTVGALESANPGVNSSRLKIGQKINLP